MATTEPKTAPKSKRELLLAAYSAQLLADPPVKGLHPGETNRERLAQHLAAKDVARFAKALAQCGLRVVAIPPAPTADPQNPEPEPQDHRAGRATGAPTPVEQMTRARLWGEWKTLLSHARSLRLNAPILPHTATDDELRAQLVAWQAQVARAEEKAGVR